MGICSYSYAKNVCDQKRSEVLLTSSFRKDIEGPTRAPIRIPEAYIEDHNLTFDSSCIGCTITLLQDDIIIYSATVEENDSMEGEVVLPDYLAGVFELQLERGSITFVGEIEL